MIKHLLLFLFCASTAYSQTPLADARAIDADGYPVLDGQTITVEGLVINENQRPGGLTFSILDVPNNVGLSVFSNDDNFGFTVTPGDFISITGTLGQFRGLCQIVPTSLSVISENNTLPPPDTITTLSEATESGLIVFLDAYFVNESDWTSSGPGFNCTMTNGTDTIAMRIDADVDIYDMPIPTGTFNIVGVGGQFDLDDPLFGGYQILPRSSADIQPYIFDGISYTPLTIPQAKETDSDGVITRDNDPVQVSGVIHGINFRPSGLQFTIIDANGNGIGVFSFDEQFGLNFAEGTEISVEGRIDQFAGLIQIVPDAITVLSENQSLAQETLVTELNESTESAYIYADNLEYADINEWLGDGSSFNVKLVQLNGDTILVRVDSDSPWSTEGPLNLGGTGRATGIGGQFDTTIPYEDGYQLVLLDIMSLVSTEDLILKYGVELFPNPVVEEFQIKSDSPVKNILIMDFQGKTIATSKNQKNINISRLNPGQYFVHFIIDNQKLTLPVIKK